METLEEVNGNYLPDVARLQLQTPAARGVVAAAPAPAQAADADADTDAAAEAAVALSKTDADTSLAPPGCILCNARLIYLNEIIPMLMDIPLLLWTRKTSRRQAFKVLQHAARGSPLLLALFLGTLLMF